MLFSGETRIEACMFFSNLKDDKCPYGNKKVVPPTLTALTYFKHFIHSTVILDMCKQEWEAQG